MDTADAENKSIECLRNTKSKENVSIVEDVTNSPKVEQSNEIVTGDSKPEQSQIETVFEKLNLKDVTQLGESEHSDITPPAIDLEENVHDDNSKSKVDIPPMEFEIEDRTLTCNTESAEVSELKGTQSSNIFSIKGTPSGRIIKRRDNASNVFPVGCMGCRGSEELDVTTSPRRFLDALEASNDHAGHIKDTPRKRPSSASNELRNPLTGEGVQIELRRQSSRRKDGNPLLGTGYDELPKVAPSKNRVPPGGHSKGIW